jgi:ATP-dependent helicase/nuclease subunit A
VSALTAFDRTRTIQREASDPASSAWVVANAGSGKTHVLTQRVIRLLLAGNDPAAILCLTFTKVAAAEMARRVFDALGRWAMLPEPQLSEAIEALQGRPPTAEEMRQARRLFARALETPGGLKIQTIHAFCERLLHQFPFEANVPGQFAILDESAAAALIATARANVMDAAAAAPDTPLGQAMRRMAENGNDQQVGEALDALIAKRDALRRWIDRSAGEGDGGIDDALVDLRRRLGLADNEAEESVCREICTAAGWSREDCEGLSAALNESLLTAPHSWNLRAQPELLAILNAETDILEADARLGFFLNWDNKKKTFRPHAQRFGKAFAESQPGLTQTFAAEADRLLALAGRMSLARAYAATEALLIVGDAILNAYHRAKRRAGALDFSDLIAKTRNLLSRSDASQWVLYKLDRRIEHILVDEAQDTSPDQWAVVKAIAEDFFSGQGASARPRTIFAVGDDKQSIFGFQGAAPEMLADMRRFFERRIAEAEAPFVARPLSLSFRSTREVLDAVDTVFDGELAARITASDYEAHSSYREDKPGHVVVMPRVVRPKVEEPEDWTAPYDAPSAAETDLANRIAEEIARLRGSVLPSGKRLDEGEILVLVRRRDAFFAAMNRALRARLIPTAGADRIPVATHIAVLDLLALADVMLLPEDDLQLAAALKSPLLGVDEDTLMQLAMGRERRSLWSALQKAEGEGLEAVAEKLHDWRGMADQVTPFHFFATVLGPEGGRRGFRARLGGEADDVLDAFLSQALAYEMTEPPSLQGFVRYIRANEADIKRETEEKATGVRVMTVHGAKGLEADVVFLVDTGGLIAPAGQRDKLVDIGSGREDPAFIWRRPAGEAPELQRAADGVADEERAREYLRLLYVAMTRARDVFYMAGIRGERTPEDCWYELVAAALAPDAERDEETGELAAACQWPQPLRPPLAAEAAAELPLTGGTVAPEWLFSPAPSPAPLPEPLRPSAGLAEPDPAPGAAEIAAAAPGDSALLRGRIVHLLLELLPAVPPEARHAAAERLLLRELPHDPDLAASVLAEAEAVLAEPALADIFGPESRAELALVGHLPTERGEYAVSGRIDRILRDSTGWHIVDFKTNRVVPATPEDADPGYVLQLALYRRLLMEIEPGVAVRASLVWTAGPNDMPIPAALMEQALKKLRIRGNPVP